MHYVHAKIRIIDPVPPITRSDEIHTTRLTQYNRLVLNNKSFDILVFSLVKIYGLANLRQYCTRIQDTKYTTHTPHVILYP